MRSPLCLASSIFVVSLASSASAQVRPMGVEVGAYGGVFEGDAVLDTAPTFGARAMFHLNRVLGLEATYGAVPTTFTDGEDESDKLVSLFGLDAVINLAAAPFTPFVTAGAGLVAVDEADFAYNIGLGAKYYFTDLLAARADLRGWFSADAPAEDEFAHFEATVGLSCQLGGDNDLDKDGVTNAADRCASEPEDRDGFQDDDGCPDTDNDADGIADADDKCPLQAEDKDGDRDDDGCPDLDDDNDSILNETDKCPAEAEDKDGFQDEDGCPDADNDQDGLLDAQDKCPNEAETKNGFKDEDGCPEGDADKDGLLDEQDTCKDQPETFNGFDDTDGCADEVPADLTAVVGIRAAISFSKEKAELAATKANEESLAELAVVLKAHPKTVILLSATAHGVADADALSTQRALAVQAALIQAGVDASQLKTRGLGAAALPADAPKAAKADRLEITLETVRPAGQ